MSLREREKQMEDEICEERSGLLLLKFDSLIDGTELRREAIATEEGSSVKGEKLELLLY